MNAYCVRSGLAMGRSPRPRSPTKCPKIDSQISEVKFWIGTGQRA